MFFSGNVVGDSTKFSFICILVQLIQTNILYAHVAAVTVVGKCAGLPLAIKTIAKELKNKSSWRMHRTG